MKGKKLNRMLLAVMALCCMAIGTSYAQNVVLQLDVNNRNMEAETEPGFQSFTIADLGTDVNGITIEIEGTLDSRRRGAPAGIEYEQIYRDFLFCRPGGMTLTLSGLEVNAEYEITIFAYDTSSAGNRIADWTWNGEVILTTSFSGGSDPTSATSHAFTGTAQSDADGRLVLECVANPDTAELSGASNPFGFINALIVSTTAVLTKAREPIPADRSLISDTSVTLGWTPGGYANSNNVYFGTSFDDVNDAAPDDPNIFLGNIAGNSFDVGSEGNPYPEGLVRGTTYYWRIDGVNEGNPDSPWKGNVWRFTVAPIAASNPGPVDNSLFADMEPLLVWDPGAYSTEHHVFFGTSYDDVLAGTGGTENRPTTEPNFSPGVLDFETTYYWRVDEFNGSDTITGDVWSFTTTVPDNGTIVMDMWQNITGNTIDLLLADSRYPDNPTSTELLTEFSTADSIGDNYGARIYGWLYVPLTGEYTFYFTSADEGQLWLSTDDDPTNIVLLATEPTWGQYDAFVRKSVPVMLVGGQRYYIEAIWKEGGDWDHCRAAWEGPGIRGQEVIQGSFLSPFAPIEAYGPIPKDGSVDVRVDPVLTWKAGKHAASHVVNFGTDPEALSQVATTQLGDESYTPSKLDFNTTYYWQVDEVNSVNPDSPWPGLLWSFTTGSYLVIEDFEDYNDYPPNEIWMTWLDGFEDPMNGSTAGYPDPDFVIGEHYMETTIVNSGSQSMPLFYDNTVGLSEVTRSISDRNWTRDGVVTLTMFYYGDAANANEPMYVALNGSAVVTNDDPDAALVTEWTRWDIPLQLFADQGLNLANVSSISLGFGRKNNPVAGGSGFVFFDDIRLYRPE